MCLSSISNSKFSQSASETLKFAREFLKFIAIGAFLYTTLLVAAPRLAMPAIDSYRWQFGMVVRDFENAKSIDLLVVGSSHVYRSFNPQIAKEQGISLVNVSSPLQTPVNSYYILKDIFDGKFSSREGSTEVGSSSTPKKIGTVVLEMYEKTMRIDPSVESYVKTLDGRRLTAGMFLEQFQLRDWDAFNYLWYKIANAPFDDPQVPPLNAHESHASGGFFPSSVVRKPRSKSTVARLQEEFDVAEAQCRSKPELCGASPLQMEYLEKIVLLCRQHNVPVIFVSVPMPTDFVETSPNIIPINQSILSLAKKVGVPFLADFRPAKLDMYSDYLDATHLNRAGAAKFTREFISQVKALGK